MGRGASIAEPAWAQSRLQSQPANASRTASAQGEEATLYGELRQVALLDGLPNEVLQGAVQGGAMTALTFERDELLLDANSMRRLASSVFFLLAGQAAVALFPSGELDELSVLPDKRRKKALARSPFIRRAEKNLATFSAGELFAPQVLPESELDRAAVYAVQPGRALVIDRAHLSDLMRAYPFFAMRVRRAADISRERLAGIRGVKVEILDFFVRNGLSVADTLRVRQLDKCIDCKACEQACEERYGQRRLTLGGPRLGMLDFVLTCRTCVDQRCLDGCNFDSIHFDKQRGEVVIHETNCTGCSMCATLCPYGAIEMVDLGRSNPLFQIRMQDMGVGKTGNGAKKAQLRRIASKCDHCADYGDQACISHCPTGALIEITPARIFRDGSELGGELTQSGYEQDIHVDLGRMLPAAPFTNGLHVADGAEAKLPGRAIPPALYWSVGLLAWFVCAVEVCLRVLAPGLSGRYFINRHIVGMDAVLARASIDYKAGCTFGVGCGYAGMALMLLTMAYVVRKHVRFFQRFGTAQSWFDFHVMCGVVGPLFILLHTALRLDNWVSIAFWSMVAVVVSGLCGRYLYTLVPRALYAIDIDRLEHQRALAQLRESQPAAVTVVDVELTAFVARVRRSRGLIRGILFALLDDLGRPLRAFFRGCRIWHRASSLSASRQINRHTAALRLLERRAVVLPQAKELLFAWKKVHVPFSVVMAILVTIHVVLAFKYSL
jgi:Fe-S-cluster-containing hydrogenase component 2